MKFNWRKRTSDVLLVAFLWVIIGAKKNEPKFQDWKVDQSIEEEKEYWRIFYNGFENVDDVLRLYKEDLFTFYMATGQYTPDLDSRFTKSFSDVHTRMRVLLCGWIKEALETCKVKFNSPDINNPIYSTPDIDGEIVGIHNSFFKGKRLKFPQVYRREFSVDEDTEGRTWLKDFIPVLEVKHIVKNGRVYEWLRLYSPEKETQAWYNVSPLGIIDAPPGTPDGEIPVDYNRAVVRSLKNSKLGARYCVQDINKGEVSFYSFLFLATPFTWRNKLSEYETSKLLKTPEGQQKYKELVQNQVFSAEANYNNDPEVLSYLKDVKNLKPHLFKMSFERFYFEYLNGGCNV